MKKLLLVVAVIVALVIIVPVAAVFLRPNNIISKEEAKKELSLPCSHFIKWQGAEIHYTDEGSGVPVLLIHGFGGSLRNFQKFDDAIKNESRVIRIDLPGFGLSDFPKTDEHSDYIQMYRDYITFILDTLHLDSLYVVGNSMGGGVAWMMAADHPDKVKKLVLLGSAGYDTKDVARKLLMFRFSAVGYVFGKGMPLFLSESGLKKCYADESKVDMNVVQLNNKFSNREGNIEHMLALARANEFPDSSLIQRVQCPTLIVWGKEDKIVPVAHAGKFHRDIKNSRVVIFDNCGHVPMMEKTEELRKVFLEFVKE